MKNKLSLLIAFSILFSGCITMPDPVDEVFLKEKTQEERVKLEKIEADVILKKKDQDKVEKDMEIVAQKTELSRKELAEAEAAKAVLLEREKLYTSTGDSKLQEIKSQRELNNIKIAQLKAKLDYYTAKSNETNALLEIKKSELAVKVAELKYEQALIAKAYQMRRKKEYEKKMIEDEEYKKYFDNQKIKLEDNQKAYEKALKELNEKKEILNKSGYEGEI
ncbi:MAG: hypothetical protein JXN64_14700 [Spirochaetes bacterium]|nr:hypothetical protein [Spirochaetota bacterium]